MVLNNVFSQCAICFLGRGGGGIAFRGLEGFMEKGIYQKASYPGSFRFLQQLAAPPCSLPRLVRNCRQAAIALFSSSRILLLSTEHSLRASSNGCQMLSVRSMVCSL